MNINIEETLSEATELEKNYEWLQASELYEQALNMIDEEDHFRKGEIQEKIGYSLHKAAFQQENKKEFIFGMENAVNAYTSAQRFFKQISDDRRVPWIRRCKAFSKYLDHWAVADPSEKFSLLTECHTLARAH